MPLSVGARVDSENKTARLDTFYSPAVAPPIVVDEDTAAWARVALERMLEIT